MNEPAGSEPGVVNSRGNRREGSSSHTGGGGAATLPERAGTGGASAGTWGAALGFSACSAGGAAAAQPIARRAKAKTNTITDYSTSAARHFRVAAVDRGTRVFWGLVVVLSGATLFYARGASEQLASAKAAEISLKTGDLVKVTQVVDGDSVVVADASGANVGVRILGIKTFGAKADRDAATRFGRDAVAAIEEMTKEEPVRVLVHSTEKDKHGRTLATLYVGDEDIGLVLVKRGLALTYTAYPVPQTQIYLEAQADAQAAERGLWGDEAVAARAVQLSREWSRGAE